MNMVEMNCELLSCRRCPRLVEWRERISIEKRRAFKDCTYWGKPVPGFGDTHARIFVVGLAPGAHGSNRTGRQFTGDASGDFLFPALFRAGYASQPNSISREDGLVLNDIYTAPICRCVPPNNKPNAEEIANCLPYLFHELEIIKPKIIVALGRIAYEGIQEILMVKGTVPLFAHLAVYQLPSKTWLICSYHPSRQNTQTGRLTREMFDQVWATAKYLLEG